jgi:hypothetical protein
LTIWHCGGCWSRPQVARFARNNVQRERSMKKAGLRPVSSSLQTIDKTRSVLPMIKKSVG